jgi:hypothetical protein
MLRSLSFRATPTASLRKKELKELRRKIVVDPQPEDVLLWLKSVEQDSALLVVPEALGKGKGSYVKGQKIDDPTTMFSVYPTRSMIKLQQLFERMLPAKGSVPKEVWRAAKPLKTLLASEEVQKQGVRHTQALVQALRSLSAARQAQQDRQGVRLAPAPTEKEEEAVSVVELETPRMTQADVLEVWQLATDAAQPGLTLTTTPKPATSTASATATRSARSKPAGDAQPASPDASTGRMVRRGKSLNLSRARMDPDSGSRGQGGD